MSDLLCMVIEAKENNNTLEELIAKFEYKIKKVSSYTSYENRQDLEQELRCKLVTCIKNYNTSSIPGLFDYISVKK